MAGAREKGGRSVLVNPVVRRVFDADGILGNGTVLLVNSLGVDHPAVIRSVAVGHGTTLTDLTARTKTDEDTRGVPGRRGLRGGCLHYEKKDDTHTSVHGATVYAGLVRDALVAQHLVSKGLVRVG